MIPAAVWMVFLFALGACVGSFLNVVVYRLPAGLSVVRPGSHCFSCNKAIAWYDNLPILSWFLLRGRCRHCGAGFSVRYALVELITGLLFVGLYGAYFLRAVRGGMPGFEQGGWVVYAGHVVLISALVASSLIDADHMIIDLGVCRLGVAVGLVLSMIWPYVLKAVEPAELWRLVPYSSARTGALALGGVLGLLIGWLLVRGGVLKRSYAELEALEAQAKTQGREPSDAEIQAAEISVNRVMGREILFLLPAALLGLLFYNVLAGQGAAGQWWSEVIEGQKWLAGLLGSVFGLMIGGGVVWVTRILGSLAFRREAMGAGDIDLMAMVGAVLGWTSPTLAFFMAPFVGLVWAIMRLVIHRTREIPYGPFLSLATLVVMVMHDRIVDHFLSVLVPPIGP